MSFFNRKPSEPTLTKGARKLSAIIDQLDELNQERAAATIGHIIKGITNLGSMPEPVIDQMWSILVTVARKAMMPGADGSKLMDQVKAGLSEKFRAMIWGPQQ